MEKLNLRFIREDDLRHVAEIERLVNRVPNEPELLQPWTMGVPGLMEIIKQRRDESTGTYDTRTMVIERTLPIAENPNAVNLQVCGCFSYELHPDGYELLFALVHPETPQENVLHLIWLFLQGKADRSPVRRRVTTFLRDRDEAGIRTLIPFWKSRGMKISLKPDHFGAHDGWKCMYESTVPVEKGAKQDDLS